MSTPSPASAQAQALRAFNRFYTRRIGVLGDGHKGSTQPDAAAAHFSLTESRVLWEVAQRPGMTAGALAQGLDLNPGYISRLLSKLQQQGLLQVVRDFCEHSNSLCSECPFPELVRQWDP